MQFKFKSFIISLTLMLSALLALSSLVFKESIFQGIQQRSKVSENLWLLDMDAQSNIFPWKNVAKVAHKYKLAVGFPYYQKTDLKGLPQPTIQPVNLEWVNQVMPLRQGRLPQKSNEMLALENGAYKIGEYVVSYQIVGLIAASPWRPVADSIVFQLVNLETARPPVAPSMILIRGDTKAEAKKIAEITLKDSGLSYRITPALDAVLANGFRDVELDSLDSISKLSIFLLFLAFIGLSDSLSAMWALKRETWRIERMLGRSVQILAFRCFIESLIYWLPSLIFAGFAASALAFVLHVPSFGSRVILIDLGFVLMALGIMGGFAWRIAVFPLARVNLEQRHGWKDQLIPIVFSTFIAIGGALLLSDAIERNNFANTRIDALGADRIDIKPDFTAKYPFEKTQCKLIVDLVKSCFTFGVVNAPPAVRNTTISDWLGVTLMDVEAAKLAKLKIIKGRWLQSGKHEIVLTRAAFEEVEALGVKLNEILDDKAPFVLVGVIENYKGKDSASFANAVFASPDDKFFMQFPQVMPIGTSGMVLRTDSPLEPTIRAIRTRLGSRITIERPAGLMLDYREKAQLDLARFSGLLGIAAIICCQVFASFVSNLIAKLGGEIAIWRILGMPVSRVIHQLIRWSLEPIIIGTIIAIFISLVLFIFHWVVGNMWLMYSVLLVIALILALISCGIAYFIIKNWTRFSPQELLSRLESV